jgi:hypothetical protein
MFKGGEIMGRQVAIGIQSYEQLITGKYFYIDKTSFIKEWWNTGDSVTLITRPRRFGKTLNMSMLECFFSYKYSGRKDLFENLSIWNDENYRNIQGNYPVISLSFANVKEMNYESAYSKIMQIISSAYDEHKYLLESDKLMDYEKNSYLKILEVSDDIDITKASMAIHKLSEYLYKHYGKRVIILLDEYDTPMQEAYVDGYWNELTSFLRSMFNATFKTNPYLERAVMTGITRVSRESMFSDLYNLEVVTTTSNKYATAFGFTETEVFAAMGDLGLDDKANVKFWYDGFTFGDISDIYNPWSIIKYLREGKFEIYWANTSSNSLVGKLIREGNHDIKENFELLMKDGILETEIDEQIVYNQLDDNVDAIWSLLLASGYLRIVSVDIKKSMYRLKLTNYEVKKMFQSMVSGWFASDKSNYNEFINALLLGDIDAMNEYMNRVALNTFSYFDTGNRASDSEPERFYHGFVLGLMVNLRDRYVITSNRESGFGRYDIMLEPLDKKYDGIIIEFKVYNKRREQNLDDTLASALAQIEDKNYAQVLIDKGIPADKIRKYGFAFMGKTVLIG